MSAKLWLVRPLGFQVNDRRLRRAGLDYWHRLEWEVVDDWPDLLTKLGTRRIWMIETRGQRLYTEASYQAGDALVFGSETRGIPDKLLDVEPRITLRLPMQSDARSLNQSNVVAVVTFEALRQINGWLGP